MQNTIYQILTGARIEWHDFEIIVVESNKQDKSGVTESEFFLLLCMWLVVIIQQAQQKLTEVHRNNLCNGHIVFTLEVHRNNLPSDIVH